MSPAQLPLPCSKTGSRPIAPPIASPSSRIDDGVVPGDVHEVVARRTRARRHDAEPRRRRRSGFIRGRPPFVERDRRVRRGRVSISRGIMRFRCPGPYGATSRRIVVAKKRLVTSRRTVRQRASSRSRSLSPQDRPPRSTADRRSRRPTPTRREHEARRPAAACVVEQSDRRRCVDGVQVDAPRRERERSPAPGGRSRRPRGSWSPRRSARSCETGCTPAPPVARDRVVTDRDRPRAAARAPE